MRINLYQIKNYKFRLIFYFFISIFFILLFNGCGRETEDELVTQPKKSDNQSENIKLKTKSDSITFWKTHTNKRYNYSISYPDNWRMDDDSRNDWKGQGYISSRLELHRYGAKQVSQDRFKDGAWLMIYIAGNPNNLALNEWVKQKGFTGKQEEIKIGSIKAVKISNEVSLPDSSGQSEIKSTATDVYISYGGKIYNISSQTFGEDYQK
ncbi:MAG: hypothetical protein HY776_01335 [Actinobacteria bacterium]|nr:hypothetical protein [Actinomycetota bacterium]